MRDYYIKIFSSIIVVIFFLGCNIYKGNIKKRKNEIGTLMKYGTNYYFYPIESFSSLDLKEEMKEIVKNKSKQDGVLLNSAQPYYTNIITCSDTMEVLWDDSLNTDSINHFVYTSRVKIKYLLIEQDVEKLKELDKKRYEFYLEIKDIGMFDVSFRKPNIIVSKLECY